MYFAALLARTEDGWQASDTELDNVETLSDLSDLARESAAEAGGLDDETVLVLIEQEDAWFGVIRVDGEEDPRVYVSDAAAASRSSYGEILLTDELLGRDPARADDLTVPDLDGTEDGDGPDETGADAGGPADDAVPAGPVGEAALLDDLGISEKELLSLGVGDALGEIAEVLGAAEVMEAVR
ncbi:hypothetical protein [Streptomyces sp. NPDC060194]|uniref:tRNA adenosine deaminase-associated protein n=1 Tax=Streptomyces sp. NPDC060194 TaxID=3347069 RepID=UPI00364D390F